MNARQFLEAHANTWVPLTSIPGHDQYDDFCAFEELGEVLGYSPEWVDEVTDNGVQVCRCDIYGEWTVAYYNDANPEYEFKNSSCPNPYNYEPSGTPTHVMIIPTPPIP